MGTVAAPPTRAPIDTGSLPVPAGLPDEASVLRRAGGENFTVASRLLPTAARRHLMAFYGYARFVDEIGDSFAGDRSEALDWVDAQLDASFAHREAGLHPLVSRAARAVEALGADPAPLRALVAANRQDQVVRRYRTFDDLLAYCRLSANPVGHLVLAAFRSASPERLEWSDRICTGLQLAEHWQDVGEDRLAGRVYLPTDDMRRFGVTEDELLPGRGSAGTALRGLLAFEAARGRRFLEEGSPLVASLSGRARLAVAGFVAGGHGALDALASAGFDPLSGPPHPARWRVGWHAVRLLVGDRGRRL